MNSTTFRSTRIALAVLALGLATSAVAGEVDTYCELATARAAVQSELLTNPEGFSSYGDPVTGARSATLGVRKYISRGKQGELVNKLGAAECSAYRADRELAEQLNGVEARAELKALQAKKPLLQAALDIATKNVITEQKLLKSQAGTLGDLKEAYDQRDRIRQELATLAGRQSMIQDQLPEVEVRLEDLVTASMLAQGDVAEINAKITAQSGWDVTVSAGARADFRTGGKTEGFVSLTATRSFGHGASTQAAARVGGLTAKLLREQRDGAYQQLLRTRDMVAGVIAAEQMAQESLTERSAGMTEALGRLNGVNTTEGLRTQRALEVEIAHITADMKASEARVEHLAKWVALNRAK